MADTIDSISEFDAVFTGLDVDITGPTTNRLNDEFINQPNNLRVARIDVD